MKDLKIGSGLRRGIAFALVFMNVLVGSKTLDNSAKAEGCSDVEFTYEYELSDEIKETFIKVLNTELGDYFLSAEFNDAVRVLNQMLTKSEYAARVKMLNGKEITIDDFDNFSKYCKNENDKKLIDRLFEEVAKVYNEAFGSGRKLTYRQYIDFINGLGVFIEEKKTGLTNSGSWAFKATGYGFSIEISHLFYEQKLGETGDKDPKLAKVVWKYLDKAEYIKNRVLKLRKDVELEKVLEILNASECLSEEEEAVATFLEMIKRLTNANREMYNCGTLGDNFGCDIYNVNGKQVFAFLPVNEEVQKGRGRA